jgi:hypothetical protein
LAARLRGGDGARRLPAFAYAALGGSLGDYSSPQALAAICVLVAMAIAGGVLL